MDFNAMTEDQKWSYIATMYERWDAEDAPENKELILSYNENVSERAKKLHEESIIIDACTFNVTRLGWRLEAAKATALNCTVPDVFGEIGDSVKAVASYYQAIREDDRFRLIISPEDILEAKKNGQTGLIIGAQSPSFLIGYDTESVLQVFRTLGLRVCQIGYNYRSFAADGCYSPDNAGLSDTGPSLIKMMEKLGVTVDLSHIGYRSALEAMDVATKPVIFSHSNPLALYKHPRNIPDECAKKCAETGGVVGVSSYNVTLWDGEHFPSIEQFLDCIEYYCNLLGVDHVGIGIDSTATEGCYSRAEIQYFTKLIRKVSGEEAVAYKAYSQGRGPINAYSLEGLGCLANWVNLIEGMVRRGFSDEEIKKLAGENWMRVFRATWN